MRQTVRGILIATFAAASTAAMLAACQGDGVETPRASAARADEPAPLSLVRPHEKPASVLMPFDEGEARRAIANYGVNKERKRAPYRMAGADLNGDGIAEVLVLFSGEDWCVTTGCSLAIFGAAKHGYKALFRTVRVKAPVIIGNASNNGWRHLFVMTGGGPAPLKRVLLRFGDDGYPSNAMLQPEVPKRARVEGETAIAAAARTTALR